MILPLLLILPLGVIFGITIWNALAAPRLRKQWPVAQYPRVSVLVPARNEEQNLPRLLESLINQRYPDYEILVLNDCSADGTGTVAQEWADRYTYLSVIQGTEPPEGWVGKNWACHQLSMRGTGEILLFTDADNWHHPEAIANTTGWMERYRLGMFSAFPQQITGSLGERLVNPVIDMFVYSWLPLWLTYLSDLPSLAAANGQWLAFRRDAYQAIGGHGSVRDNPVEDTALARLAKKHGIPIMTAAGTGMVYTRMYRSMGQVWQGFSKNLFGLSGYSVPLLTLLMTLLLWTGVVPYAMVFLPGTFILGLAGIVINVVTRLLLVLRYRHPMGTSVILHPLGILLTAAVAVNSVIQYSRGGLSWKGRVLPERIAGRPSTFMEKIPGGRYTWKLFLLYLLLMSGGLWHILGFFQQIMELMAGPLIGALGFWIGWEYYRTMEKRCRSRFLWWILLVLVLTFGLELVGVRTGQIFGDYAYGSVLKPEIAGVPAVIGFAWVIVLLSGYSLAMRLLRRTSFEGVLIRVLTGALLMMLFDMVMEPAAGHLGYWQWQGGVVPLQNYAVWFGACLIFLSGGVVSKALPEEGASMAVHFYWAQLIYFALVLLS